MSRILRSYLTHRDALIRYIARFGPCAEEADDIAQETFLKGFAAEQITEIREPRAFLFRIAKNLALGELRTRRRAQTEKIEDFGGDGIIVDERQMHAEDQLDASRKMATLAMAVALLPPQCRRVFLMARVEGLRHKQIASRLNITVSNVEKLVAKGLLKCNQYLRDHGYEPSEFGAKDRKTAMKASMQRSEEGGGHD